jgi:hypothetical protein
VPVRLYLRGCGPEPCRDIPPAPLASVVVNAKKVFLTNGGGSDLAYDTFASEIKKWGKYEVVGSPDDADLIVPDILSCPSLRLQAAPIESQCPVAVLL